MNSDTDILIEEIIIKSGAVTKCSRCGNFLLDAYDDDAEKVAYGMATNAWKDGQRGFRGMEREEVVAKMEQALKRTRSKCPSCDRE